MSRFVFFFRLGLLLNYLPYFFLLPHELLGWRGMVVTKLMTAFWSCFCFCGI